MRTRTTLLVAGLAVLALTFSGCAAVPSGDGLAATERTFHISAIEPKGTTNVEKEPFPGQALPAGGGYKISEPDDTGNWTVSTHVWMPSEFIVYQGDRVTFEIVGIYGSSHPSVIEGYDVSFDVLRGQVTTISFTADKVGVFQILCAAHHPSMTGTLVVLPRG